MKKLGKKLSQDNETLEAYGGPCSCSCFCWCTYYSHAEAYAEDYTRMLPDFNTGKVLNQWPGY